MPKSEPQTTSSARLVASILTDNGHAVSSPDDGDLDDVELERWNVCVEIADRVEAPLRVENALLRQSLDADGALRQFVRLTGPTLRAAGCHEAAERLSELIAASDAAREPLRARGIFTNG